MLSKLIDGPSANTLLVIDIPDETVTVRNVKTLVILKALVTANFKKREDKLGRKILPEHSDFLNDDYDECN